MSVLQKFQLGGLDLKSNDLVRSINKSSYLRNVIKTQKGDINKVPGYALVELFSGSQELEESCYFKSTNEELFVKSDGNCYKSYNSLIKQDLTYFSVAAGSEGALISIAYTGGATAGAEVVTVTGNAISIQIQSGVSTATQVKAALVASVSAMALVGASITGTAGTAQVTSAAALLTTTRVNASISTLFPNVDVVVKNRIVYDEYLNNLYITTNDRKSAVIKYDGSNVYVAGLPAANKLYAGTIYNYTGVGTTYYYRWFYGHYDLNGNLTLGPYVQQASSSATSTIEVSTFKTGNPLGAFCNRYLNVGLAGYTVSATQNTMGYVTTNYVAGDKFLLLLDGNQAKLSITDSANRKFKVLTIIKVDSGTNLIHFNPADFDGLSFTTNATATTYNIDARSRVYIFRSTSASFGYVLTDPTFAANTSYLPTDYILDNSSDNISMVAAAATTNGSKLEDFYNEDGQKLRPPQCGYLCTYGDQLIFANIQGFWDQDNVFVNYNNNDLVSYSNIGLADNGENNSADIQRIGNSFDGEVTGVARCNDVVMISKNNGIFAMDGIIESGGYTLRKIPTDYIGCESHQSILQVNGGLFFHGNDGIYFTDGVICKPVSEELDPIFNSMLTTRSKSTINSGNKRFLMYMTDGTTHYLMMYSYEFKEWFIRESIDASKGIYEKNNKTVDFAKNNSTYAMENAPTGLSSTYSDAGSAIAASYYTNWESLGQPGLRKKFKGIRVWNLSSVATTFTLNTQCDWVDTDMETAMSYTITANTSLYIAHPQRNCFAIRYVFKNSTAGANMIISAYEIDYEMNQKYDKGGTSG